ncbi:hypothetical protein CXB51_029887 [Gossypium anomalum]|uniref:Uncharacterized protein n=1 Tax=Gossypium anomalum TaxID=47600 RepID=A0A8J5Y7N2_9ROSI|nr:hypothetical protein CXB51_029887 [Gossypium anomalum]
MVIENGAAPIFVKLLGSPSHNVVCALGNVAGDSPKCRELVLGHGDIGGSWTYIFFCCLFLALIFHPVTLSISNLMLMFTLTCTMKRCVMKEAAWDMKNATSGGTHDQIKFLISQGCIKPLCDLLSCPDPRKVTVCFERLENILEAGETDENMDTTGEVNLYAQMVEMQIEIYRLMTTIRCIQRLHIGDTTQTRCRGCEISVSSGAARGI